MYSNANLDSACLGDPFKMTPSELREFILKLQWIGRDDEAERLAGLLSRTTLAQSVILGPRETD